MIFCFKKQRTNAKSGRTKVADWQDVGVDKFTRDDRCRIGSERVDFRQILTTDFCVAYRAELYRLARIIMRVDLGLQMSCLINFDVNNIYNLRGFIGGLCMHVLGCT